MPVLERHAPLKITQKIKINPFISITICTDLSNEYIPDAYNGFKAKIISREIQQKAAILACQIEFQFLSKF